MTSLTFKSWLVSSILQHRSLIAIMFNPFHVPGLVGNTAHHKSSWLKTGPGASPCWTSVRTGQTSRRNLYMPFLSWQLGGNVPPCSNWPPIFDMKNLNGFQIHMARKWILIIGDVLSKRSKFPKPAEAAASIPNMIRVQIGPHPGELATTRSNLSAYTLSTIA